MAGEGPKSPNMPGGGPRPIIIMPPPEGRHPVMRGPISPPIIDMPPSEGRRPDGDGPALTKS
jgi:hypothetical protein